MLYCTVVRFKVEYGSVVWSPYTSRNVHKPELIQWMGTKFILTKRNLTYEEHLKCLNSLLLEKRHIFLMLHFCIRQPIYFPGIKFTGILKNIPDFIWIYLCLRFYLSKPKQLKYRFFILTHLLVTYNLNILIINEWSFCYYFEVPKCLNNAFGIQPLQILGFEWGSITMIESYILCALFAHRKKYMVVI